jgi:hypothetical protein
MEAERMQSLAVIEKLNGRKVNNKEAALNPQVKGCPGAEEAGGQEEEDTRGEHVSTKQEGEKGERMNGRGGCPTECSVIGWRRVE